MFGSPCCRVPVAFIPFLLAACSGSNGLGDKAEDDPQAAVSFQVGDASFEGNSVRICGERGLPADPKFRCDSELPADSSCVQVPGEEPGQECPCFNFTARGQIVDPCDPTNASVAIRNLCPSTNVPSADWTFTYTLFSEEGCEGEILNTDQNDNNFVCFDSNDLLSQQNPNASVEDLEPGINTNHILCITENASKTFDFLSCVLTTTIEDEQANATRFDCGCALELGVCSCDGLTAADLEEGCVFDPETCEIVCSENATFACSEDIFVSSTSGTTTALFLLDPNTFGVTPIAFTDEFGYDAIGFNHEDGFLYGISNNTVGFAQPRLVRIDRFGNVTDLGTFPELAGEEWIVGTILADGTYLIGNFAPGPAPFEWVMIELEGTPSVIASGSIPLTGSFNSGPSAWAAHPTDGLTYGHQPFTRSLSAFLPDTAAGTLTLVSNVPITSSTPEQIDIGQGCSAAFEKDGTLLFYCKEAGNPGVDALFSVDVDTAVSTFLTNELPLAAGDMASCVFDVPTP